MFSGDELVRSLLRPSNIYGAKYAGAISEIIVSKMRKRWPSIKIIFRGYCTFTRKHILHWCENNEVEYIVGISCNKALRVLVKDNEEELMTKQKELGCQQKEYMSFKYQAGSWKKEKNYC